MRIRFIGQKMRSAVRVIVPPDPAVRFTPARFNFSTQPKTATPKRGFHIMEMPMQTQRSESSINLYDLPGLVLRHLGSFLDSVDVIALTRVNRKLRQSLIINLVWKDFFDQMEVEKLTPFNEILHR